MAKLSLLHHLQPQHRARDILRLAHSSRLIERRAQPAISQPRRSARLASTSRPNLRRDSGWRTGPLRQPPDAVQSDAPRPDRGEVRPLAWSIEIEPLLPPKKSSAR